MKIDLRSLIVKLLVKGEKAQIHDLALESSFKPVQTVIKMNCELLSGYMSKKPTDVTTPNSWLRLLSFSVS